MQLVSTLLMLCTSDIYTLINYVGFVNYLFYGVTVAGLIVLRVREPSRHRPIKVTAPFTLTSSSYEVLTPGSWSRSAWCGRWSTCCFGPS